MSTPGHVPSLRDNAVAEMKKRYKSHLNLLLKKRSAKQEDIKHWSEWRQREFNKAREVEIEMLNETKQYTTSAVTFWNPPADDDHRYTFCSSIGHFEPVEKQPDFIYNYGFGKIADKIDELSDVPRMSPSTYRNIMRLQMSSRKRYRLGTKGRILLHKENAK